MTTAALMPSQIQGKKTLQIELQRQHSVPNIENIPLPTPLGLKQSRFPVVSNEVVITDGTELKNTNTAVRRKCCAVRNI